MAQHTSLSLADAETTVHSILNKMQAGNDFCEAAYLSSARIAAGTGNIKLLCDAVLLLKGLRTPLSRELAIALRDLAVVNMMRGGVLTKEQLKEQIAEHCGYPLAHDLSSQLLLAFHHIVRGKYAKGARPRRAKRVKLPSDTQPMKVILLNAMD